MLELVAISKSYRSGISETRVLTDYSMMVDRGEFVAVMGPSGCGKTTLLNILGLIDVPESGAYYLDGREVTAQSEQRELCHLRGRAFGFVLQFFGLIDYFSVAQNIEIPLMYARVTRRERRRAVDSILSDFGISDLRDRLPSEISIGQQQRVAIARSLVREPEIILADEPTGSLDAENGKVVMDILKRQHELGKTIVMVTHNENHVGYVDRVVRLG